MSFQNEWEAECDREIKMAALARKISPVINKIAARILEQQGFAVSLLDVQNYVDSTDPDEAQAAQAAIAAIDVLEEYLRNYQLNLFEICGVSSDGDF